jgi:hypothetical protein
MIPFVEAVDDYLHLIVRTRPWTKKDDEELLTAFGEWLEQRSPAQIDDVTHELIAAYVADARLGPADEQAVRTALGRLLSWAEWQGLVPPRTPGVGQSM